MYLLVGAVNMYRLYIVAVLASSVYADVVLPGSCEYQDRQTDPIMLTKVDVWYEIERLDNRFENGQCATNEFQLDYPTVYAYNKEIVNKTVEYNNGTLISVDSNGVALLNFSAQLVQIQVLKSDFKTYALLYGCANTGGENKTVWGWKLSSTSTLSSENNQLINEVLKDTELQNVTWTPISHSEDVCGNTAVSVRGFATILLSLGIVLQYLTRK